MAETWESKCGNVVLMRGDCIDELPKLDRKFDAVIVDIPYGAVNRKSAGLRNLDKGDADIETFDTSLVIEHSHRLGSTAYVWCGTEQVSEIRAGFVKAGMTTRMCGWEKSNPSPMNGQYMWLSSFECCVFARSRAAWFGRHCKSPIWRGPICRSKIHPTQKPEWLLKEQVEASVRPAEWCLDFCMGSGTTGVAAVKSGRKFFGIEKNAEYFAAAKLRIEAAILESDDI